MSRSATEIIDKHSITKEDALFQLPPTINQLRGARGNALIFTQQQQQLKQQGRMAGKIDSGIDSRSAGDNRLSSEAKQPLLHNSKQQQQQQQQQQQAAGSAEAAAAAATADRMESSATTTSEKNRRQMIMNRAREYPAIDKIITVLQDKRINDDDTEAVQDLQLPLLRKVLNVIFIAVGVIFLLGVVVVIIYTSIMDARIAEENAATATAATTAPAA